MPFRLSILRKIVPVNLYDPHAAVDNEVKIGPGPGKYDIADGFRGKTSAEEAEEQMNNEKVNHIPGGKLYIENNLDRFGQPIMPRRPLDLVPGPGEY